MAIKKVKVVRKSPVTQQLKRKFVLNAGDLSKLSLSSQDINVISLAALNRELAKQDVFSVINASGASSNAKDIVTIILHGWQKFSVKSDAKTESNQLKKAIADNYVIWASALKDSEVHSSPTKTKRAKSSRTSKAFEGAKIA